MACRHTSDSDPESTSEVSDDDVAKTSPRKAIKPSKAHRVRDEHIMLSDDWALVKTLTTLERDLSTLNGYSDLPYLEPKEIKNAVFLLAKVYTPTAENIRYILEENRKEDLTTEEISEPPTANIEIGHNLRKLEIYVKIISTYPGGEAMNKLKAIMTAAILGNAQTNDSFDNLYQKMGGQYTEVKVRIVRLTCDKHPGLHDTKYGIKIPPQWWRRVGAPCSSLRCPGHIIAQELDGLYWNEIDSLHAAAHT